MFTASPVFTVLEDSPLAKNPPISPLTLGPPTQQPPHPPLSNPNPYRIIKQTIRRCRSRRSTAVPTVDLDILLHSGTSFNAENAVRQRLNGGGKPTDYGFENDQDRYIRTVSRLSQRDGSEASKRNRIGWTASDVVLFVW